ncbi:MAG: hypothetical protein AAF497_17600, partial [Planctomycetota bacterium]
MIIYLDCDGVLADFAGAAGRRHGIPEVPNKWDWYKDHGLTTTEFFDRLRDVEFWRDEIQPFESPADVKQVVSPF